MSQRLRKFTAGLVLVTISILVAGLCYGTVSQAATQNAIAVAPDQHCEPSEQYAQAKTTISEPGYPVGSSVMPCCVDRHDNIPTTVPASSNDQITFLGTAVGPINTDAASYAGQKTYFSSSSPPPRPDKLFSLLKKE